MADAYLDNLIAACDALEQRIVDAQQACGRALAALNAARLEMGLPVPTYPLKRVAVSLGQLDPTDPIVAKMIENGDIEVTPIRKATP